MRAATNPDLHALIAQLRERGAVVVTGKLATEEELRRAEARLGFAVPAEAREFFSEVGQLKITLERTWNFYGLAEALERAEEYRTVFEAFRSGDDEEGGPYYPKRFLVLHDEGDYSNRAAGTVYDADIEGFLVTDGGRIVERAEAFFVGYWGLLLDEVSEILDRVDDPDTRERLAIASSRSNREPNDSTETARIVGSGSGSLATIASAQCTTAGISRRPRSTS